jgi:hypothetical protein
MKKIIIMSVIMTSLFLGGCDVGKDDVIQDIKYNMSIEYQVPITDVKVETVEYGISVFTTNQFKVTIESKGLAFNLVDTESRNKYTRFPIPTDE